MVLTVALLVTVRGPSTTLDLEIPGDVPVRELLPLLLELCGDTVPGPSQEVPALFALFLEGSRTPLLPEQTLREAAVQDGSVLFLQPASLPVAPPEPERFVPRVLHPAEETGGIGLTWARLE